MASGGWSRPALGLLSGVCLALAGCGWDADEPAASDQAREAITPRGLAAGVLRHLDPDQVGGVAGSQDVASISVMIDTQGPAVRIVGVDVVPGRVSRELRHCDIDPGYAQVECRDAHGLFEIERRVGSDDRDPALMGYAYDKERGNVVVQTWGSSDAGAEHLVRALLSDPLLGQKTSAALNDEGEALPEFEKLGLSSGSLSSES